MNSPAGRAEPAPVGPYALYRWFDAQDCLLYLGKTAELGQRVSGHIARSLWMQFVASSTVERRQTAEELARDEREAIETEHPIFNKQYNNTPEAKRRLRAYLADAGRLDLLYARNRVGVMAIEGESVRWWDAVPGGFKPDRSWRWMRDQDGPVLETAADFRDRWRGDLTGPFSYVRPQGGGKWAVHEIGAVYEHESKLIVQEGLLEGLLYAGRCDAISPGQDASVYGFRSWQEAQAVAWLLTQIDWMFTRDVLPYLWELEKMILPAPCRRLSRAITLALEDVRQHDLWSGAYDDPLIGPFLEAINRRWLASRNQLCATPK